MRLGPFSLPLEILSIVFSLCAAYLFFRLVSKLSKEERREGFNRLANAVFLALLVWKLSPLLLHFDRIGFSLINLLYYPPGQTETILALIGFLLVFGLPFLRHKKLQDLRQLAWIVLLTVFFVCYPLAQRGLQTLLRSETALPSIDLLDETGTRKQLLFSEHNEVILHFWTSWCPSCKAEMAVLDSFFENKPLHNFYAILIPTESEDTATLQEYNTSLSYTNYLPAVQSQLSTLDIRAIPTTLIIDSAGNIVLHKTGGLSSSWLSSRVQIFEP